MRKRHYFDIETAPLPDAKERVLADHPFDPASVKLGNLKDPEKIAAKMEEAELSHYASYLNGAQLDPHLSYVCAIGILDDNGPRFLVAKEPDEEGPILQRFWEWVDATVPHPDLIGWNIHGFDLPYLMKRSWHHKLKVSFNVMRGRYFNDFFVDLMKVYCCYSFRDFAGLKQAARFLKVSKPREHGVSGKDFYKVLGEDEERALRYLLDDLEETKRIAEVIL